MLCLARLNRSVMCVAKVPLSQLFVFQWLCVCVSECSARCIWGKITDGLEMGSVTLIHKMILRSQSPTLDRSGPKLWLSTTVVGSLGSPYKHNKRGEERAGRGEREREIHKDSETERTRERGGKEKGERERRIRRIRIRQIDR